MLDAAEREGLEPTTRNAKDTSGDLPLEGEKKKKWLNMMRACSAINGSVNFCVIACASWT